MTRRSAEGETVSAVRARLAQREREVALPLSLDGIQGPVYAYELLAVR